MKLAIMQPYLFPYVGYFQLLNEVDKFVFYDDVNFRKQGWINRNSIVTSNGSFVFTVPLEQISSFTLINETFIDLKKYPFWKKKFFKTIEQAYSSAPFYKDVIVILKNVFDVQKKMTISEMAKHSIVEVANYLNCETIIQDSSTIYKNSHLSSQDRVLDICLKEKAKVYINPIGGMDLYNVQVFQERDLKLKFLESI